MAFQLYTNEISFFFFLANYDTSSNELIHLHVSILIVKRVYQMSNHLVVHVVQNVDMQACLTIFVFIYNI